MSMTLSNESTGMSLADLRGGSRTDTGRFDPEAFHAMERRDDALVADSILRGAMSGAFVYNFKISGKDVQGVSVIGARHIASKYGALRHRIVASMEKRGARVICQSYPFEKTPMGMNLLYLPEIEAEMDFYKVVVEITDIKTGYTLQVEKSENRFERRNEENGGTLYERPNFQIIAQSKAFRNGVLDVIPQDLMLQFKAECIKLGKSVDVTNDIMDEKRRAIIGYAARVAIPVDRSAVALLTFDQINGLAEATRQIAEAQKAADTQEAREEVKQRFVGTLAALGLTQPTEDDATSKKRDESGNAKPVQGAGPTPKRGRGPAKDAAPNATQSAGETTGDGRPVPPPDEREVRETTQSEPTGSQQVTRPQTDQRQNDAPLLHQVAPEQRAAAMDLGSGSDMFGGME